MKLRNTGHSLFLFVAASFVWAYACEKTNKSNKNSHHWNMERTEGSILDEILSPRPSPETTPSTECQDAIDALVKDCIAFHEENKATAVFTLDGFLLECLADAGFNAPKVISNDTLKKCDCGSDPKKQPIGYCSNPPAGETPSLESPNPTELPPPPSPTATSEPK